MPSIWTNFDQVFEVSQGLFFRFLLIAKRGAGDEVGLKLDFLLYYCGLKQVKLIDMPIAKEYSFRLNFVMKNRSIKSSKQQK